MHRELVCHQKHGPYTNTRENQLKVCFMEECIWATICYVGVWLLCILMYCLYLRKCGVHGELRTRFGTLLMF